MMVGKVSFPPLRPSSRCCRRLGRRGYGVVGLRQRDTIITRTRIPGQSQFLTTPMIAKPLDFGNLTLDDPSYEQDVTRAPADSDARLMEMLAAQAARQQVGPVLDDENAILADEKLSESEKKDLLQKALNMAASNGDVERVTKILSGDAKPLININATDEDGTPPLIYASCFVGANCKSRGP